MTEQDRSTDIPEVIRDGEAAGSPAIPRDVLPTSIYLIPITNRPFMPGQIQPVMVDAERWGETLKRVANTAHRMVGLVYVPNPVDAILPDQPTLPMTGCLVQVHRISEEKGQLQFVAQGIRRFRIRHWLHRSRPYLVDVEYPRTPDAEDPQQIKAYALAMINTIKELLKLSPLYSEELKQYLTHFGPEQPEPLTDFAASMTTASGEELQEVLDTLPLVKRMEKVLHLLRQEAEVARLQTEIREEVNEKIQKHQREFFLREQLKVIQKELGMQKDDRTADTEEFEARMAALNPSEAVMKKFREELKKLSVLDPHSAEYGVARNYLDWLTQVPWGHYSADNLDLKHARKVLDAEHDGLDDIKDRIIEFLAEAAYKGEVRGSIILLVGPPGVGKTSIGRSIAAALGREFYRFSVGGMRDEAEIKGHRRTYIGALPGRIVQALKETGTSNPVIMLDEIDKISHSYQGDPASALLETLDPEQNSAFMDHYLDVRLDLSRVLFICTANTLDSIPGPLLDRMEIIRLSGYLTDEKLAIARHHLWRRLLERAGVAPDRIRITDAAIRHIIEGYAREAGVRNLEKQLHRVLRKAVVRLLDDPQARVSIGVKDLKTYLGEPVFRKEKQLKGVGVVTGLAWTAMGGATLPVEAQLIHTANRGFKLTGQLGDVMRESAEIAYSFISSRLKQYKGDPAFFDKAFVHLHVPEGATPKDGPSAGITMATALLSLARNQAPKAGVAMTGELTLTGQVFPVGGIREKVIAARRQGIREIILPAANRGDVEELPDYVREGVTFYFASTFDDVFRVMFSS